MKKAILVIMILVLLVSGCLAWFLYFKNKPQAEVPFNYDPGDYFVTDIKDSKSLLKTDIILAMADTNQQTELTANNHRIRDAIIFVLRDKTEAELKSPDIRENVEKEIISLLNQNFNTDNFLDLYFNEFVIQ
ncbi:MAG: flagellar basal body-associated FliL family protein [Clostridiaceae bacterium]|nr:flagellar basal body-associated FliL family protein [Clostridiaceae bacterium]